MNDYIVVFNVKEHFNILEKKDFYVKVKSINTDHKSWD